MTQIALTPIAAARPLRRYPGRQVSIALWLPLTPILVLLAPLVMVGATLGWLWRAGRRARPLRAAWALGLLLASLSGTVVAVDAPRARVRIRIF